MCDVCRDGECLPRVGLCKAELIWCTCSKAGCKSPQLRRVKKLLASGLALPQRESGCVVKHSSSFVVLLVVLQLTGRCFGSCWF